MKIWTSNLLKGHSFLLIFAVATASIIANTSTLVQVQKIENQALYRKNSHQQWQILIEGMTLKTGYEIKTLEDTRLVISFGKYGVVRVAPQSQLKINPPPSLQQESFDLSLVFGKAWAKIKNQLQSSGSRLILRTRNAAIHIKGTTYEASFEGDQTRVRVFSGQVNVNSEQMQEPDLSLKPNEIEAPHEVSRQEWSVIVSAFETVIVSGTKHPDQPIPFQLDQSDRWANWNLQQDQSLIYNSQN